MHSDGLWQADVVVIGSGIGGATVARRLAERGIRVLIIERGSALPSEAANWSVEEVFLRKKYTAQETWLDRRGGSFRPSIYYNVGGCSKFYAASLPRLRERDFEQVQHAEGVSPSWPIRYADLEPYYDQAEIMYGVHGAPGDETEPPRRRPYPHAPIPSEPMILEVAERLRRVGLPMFPLPLGIDQHDGGKCIRCGTCDGFPCRIGAKNDAETRGVIPAIATGNARLLTEMTAQRLILAADGRRIEAVEVLHRGERRRIAGSHFVVACSAINSAALLIKSAAGAFPKGLANSSGVVGRHYMAHNNTAMMCVGWSVNQSVFQKTLVSNRYYFGDDKFAFPMGNIQLLGKLQAGMLTAGSPLLPRFLSAAFARRSVDWWIMSEDLPDPDNRVIVEGDKIRLSLSQNNMKAHRRLVEVTRRAMRRAGFPLVLSKTMPTGSTSHQCGTVRFGLDPGTAALDPYCRAYDHHNLFVVDSSFFPSSAAVNPSLTIAAQALRTADHMLARDFGETLPEASSDRDQVDAALPR